MVASLEGPSTADKVKRWDDSLDGWVHAFAAWASKGKVFAPKASDHAESGGALTIPLDVPCAKSEAVLSSNLEKALQTLDVAMKELSHDMQMLAHVSMTLPRADAVLFGSCSERDNFKVMGKVWKHVTAALMSISQTERGGAKDGALKAVVPDEIAAFALARIENALLRSSASSAASTKIARYFWQRIGEILRHVPVEPRASTLERIFSVVVSTHEYMPESDKVISSAHATLQQCLKGRSSLEFLRVACLMKNPASAHIAATVRALRSSAHSMNVQQIEGIIKSVVQMMVSSKDFACSSVHMKCTATDLSALLVEKKHIPVDTMLAWASGNHVIVREFACALWSTVCTHIAPIDEIALASRIAEAASRAALAESARCVMRATDGSGFGVPDPNSEAFLLARFFDDLSPALSLEAKMGAMRTLLRTAGDPFTKRTPDARTTICIGGVSLVLRELSGSPKCFGHAICTNPEAVRKNADLVYSILNRASALSKTLFGPRKIDGAHSRVLAYYLAALLDCARFFAGCIGPDGTRGRMREHGQVGALANAVIQLTCQRIIGAVTGNELPRADAAIVVLSAVALGCKICVDNGMQAYS